MEPGNWLVMERFYLHSVRIFWVNVVLVGNIEEKKFHNTIERWAYVNCMFLCLNNIIQHGNHGKKNSYFSIKFCKLILCIHSKFWFEKFIWLLYCVNPAVWYTQSEIKSVQAWLTYDFWLYRWNFLSQKSSSNAGWC